MSTSIVDFETGKPLRPGYLEFMMAHQQQRVDQQIKAERERYQAEDASLWRVMASEARCTSAALGGVDRLEKRITEIEQRIAALQARLDAYEAGGRYDDQ